MTHPRDVAIDTETRERLELRSKARVGDFVAAFVEGRSLDGTSAEYRAAHGMTGYELPLDLFEPDAARVETRAVTAAPTDTPVQASPVQPYVYAQGAAAFLGVDLVTVGSGAHMFPALTTATPTAIRLRSSDATSDPRRGKRCWSNRKWRWRIVPRPHRDEIFRSRGSARILHAISSSCARRSRATSARRAGSRAVSSTARREPSGARKLAAIRGHVG